MNIIADQIVRFPWIHNVPLCTINIEFSNCIGRSASKSNTCRKFNILCNSLDRKITTNSMRRVGYLVFANFFLTWIRSIFHCTREWLHARSLQMLPRDFCRLQKNLGILDDPGVWRWLSDRNPLGRRQQYSSYLK